MFQGNNFPKVHFLKHPRNKEQLWRSSYEELHDFIVPASTKQFNIDQKNKNAKANINLFRIISFVNCRDDIINKAKNELKFFRFFLILIIK